LIALADDGRLAAGMVSFGLLSLISRPALATIVLVNSGSFETFVGNQVASVMSAGSTRPGVWCGRGAVAARLAVAVAHGCTHVACTRFADREGWCGPTGARASRDNSANSHPT
jgi:hypothetical protein